MIQGRPPRLGGALVEPNLRMFDLVLWIVRRLQPATLATCMALNGTLLAIILPISTCCDSARCGAILGRELLLTFVDA
jgi:hypothetical protein